MLGKRARQVSPTKTIQQVKALTMSMRTQAPKERSALTLTALQIGLQVILDHYGMLALVESQGIAADECAVVMLRAECALSEIEIKETKQRVIHRS